MSETFGFPSSDGKSDIHALLWNGGAERPRGIVQLVHGMAEHIGRYDEFARFLATHGYVVCGHDHIGHGQSVRDRSEWGRIPLDGGADLLVADVHGLRSRVQPRYAPDTPYFLFGHSMGSFVVRVYLGEHADGLSGAVICGTGHIPPALSKTGNALARLLARLRGGDHVSSLLNDMGVGGYNKSVDNPRTNVDWLSCDTDNVDRYLADEACGFPFAASGNAALTDLTGRLGSGAWAQRIPRELPLLFVSGALDPVGDMGKGVRTAYGHAVDAGIADVDVKLYEGMRHEILNETGRAAVYADILEWMEGHRP